MSSQSNYREAVNRIYSSLKGKKRVIADRVLSEPIQMIEKSIADFARDCQCDQTTVVRFAQMLGYSGYAELKIAVARQSEALWQEFNSNSMTSSAAEPKKKGNNVTESLMRIHCESITGTIRNLNDHALRKMITRIEKAERIMICGAGTSALAAEDLSVKLSRQGIHTIFYRDPEMWKTFLGYLGRSDLLILISNSGETPCVTELAKTARQKKIPVAGIVSFPGSSLAKCADILLLTENRGELPIRLGAMTSRTAQFMIVDLLTILYSMENRKKSWDYLEKSYV